METLFAASSPKTSPILEDNKPQKIVSFDVENIDAVATQDVTQAKPLPDSHVEPAKSCKRRSLGNAGESVSRTAD